MANEDIKGLTGIPSWYIIKIMDGVSTLYQSTGGYLDGTMLEGDENVGLVKYPFFGRFEAVELVENAVEKVKPSEGDMGVVESRLKDYEVSHWINVLTKNRMGPNYQQAIIQGCNFALKRRSDMIRINALKAFTTDKVDLDASARIVNLVDLKTAAMTVSGLDTVTGDDMYCPLPENMFDQLMLEPELSTSLYQNGASLPNTNPGKITSKKIGKVTYLSVPFELYFDPKITWPATLDIFMWAKSAVGSNVVRRDNTVSINPMPGYMGTPWLVKALLSATAVGINREGVRRIKFKNNLELKKSPIVVQQIAI